MEKVTFEDIKKLAIDARGSVDKIYLHWTAGRYGQFFDDYHLNIDADGSVYSSMEGTDDDGNEGFAQKKAHTWHRNTGAIGIGLACCLGAHSTDNLGDLPPTPAQLESMYEVTGIICKYAGIPCDSDHVMTHAEAAELDNYGPSTTCERWDGWVWIAGDPAGNGGDLARGKAAYYIENTNV